MSPPEDRDTFAAELICWLNAKVVPAGVSVTRATPLFEHGLINSIRILEIIAWVERATERRIPDRDIRMDNFATVDRIAAVFAPECADVDA